MTVRSEVVERLQIGVETTPGTAVAANRRIRSFDLKAAPQLESERRRAAGNKFASQIIAGKEWTNWALDGTIDYNEIVYLLSCVMDAATVTTPTGATDARLWSFEIDVDALDAPKTLTVEQGQAARAHRSAFVMIPELSFELDRSKVALTGSGIGTRLEDGHTMTASPTDITERPVLPSQWSLYLDDASADLGNTLLTAVPKVKFALSGRFGPFWAINAAKTSFSDRVETEPDGKLELTVVADATGMALLDAYRAGGATKFLRIQSADAADSIESGQDYGLTLDMAVQVETMQDLGEMDGAKVARFGLALVSDAGWGKSITAAVTNKVASL